MIAEQSCASFESLVNAVCSLRRGIAFIAHLQQMRHTDRVKALKCCLKAISIYVAYHLEETSGGLLVSQHLSTIALLF